MSNLSIDDEKDCWVDVLDDDLKEYERDTIKQNGLTHYYNKKTIINKTRYSTQMQIIKDKIKIKLQLSKINKKIKTTNINDDKYNHLICEYNRLVSKYNHMLDKDRLFLLYYND